MDAAFGLLTAVALHFSKEPLFFFRAFMVRRAHHERRLACGKWRRNLDSGGFLTSPPVRRSHNGIVVGAQLYWANGLSLYGSAAIAQRSCAPTLRLRAAERGVSTSPTLRYCQGRFLPGGTDRSRAALLGSRWSFAGRRLGEVGSLIKETLGILRDALEAHLEVQMRAGGTAGVAAQGDQLATLDDLTRLDLKFREVGIARRELVAVVEFDQVAILRVVARAIDDTTGRGEHRRSRLRAEVDALVHGAHAGEGVDAPAER